MSHLKPTQTLDVLGELNLKPEKSIEFFTESKQQNHLFVKPPNWDSVGDDIELITVQNAREHTKMLYLQDNIRAGANHMRVINEHRIEQLFRMHKELKLRFIDTNSFLKDCDDKRKFAEAIVTEEKHTHSTLRGVIQKYKEEIDLLLEFRKQLKSTIKEFEPYEAVINEVIKKSSYTSVQDCMARCDALMMTQVEILEMKRDKIQEIEEMRHKMLKLTNEAALTVLGLNNELAQLQRGYSIASTECTRWEKLLVEAKNEIVNTTLMKNQIMDGIQTMCAILFKRRSSPIVINKTDINAQMDFIRSEIRILTAVYDECVKNTKHNIQN